MTAKVPVLSKPEPPKGMLPNEIQLCEMLADPEYALMSKTKIAEKIGISRQRLYVYMSRQRVLEYMNALVAYYTDLEMPGVWKALVKKAKAGDMGAIKLYFEMKGKYIPPSVRAELDLKGMQATINIISRIPRPAGALQDPNIIEVESYEVENGEDN